VSSAATTTAAALGFDPDEQRVIEERRARRLQRLARRELVSIGVLAGGFLVAAVSTALLLPSDRSPALPAVVLLVLAYAAAFRLDFSSRAGTSSMANSAPEGADRHHRACGSVISHKGQDHMNLFVTRTWLQAKFSKDEKGASMVEYILLVALIALAVIAAVVFLKNQVNSKFNDAGSKLSSSGT